MTTPKQPASQPHKYTAQFANLVDLVIDQEKIKFLIIEGGELVLKDQVKIGSDTFVPPESKSVPWMLARAERVIAHHSQYSHQDCAGINQKLFDDLVEHHRTVSDLPLEQHYPLIATWVIHTYFQEHIDYSPILSFYAPPGRGKSRTCNGAVYIAYRGYCVGSARPAHLVRSANFKSSIFLDLTDAWGAAVASGSQDVLLLRCAKGSKIALVNRPESGPLGDTDYYDIFGPTIIATNTPLNLTLETRCIAISIQPSTKIFNNTVTEAAFLPLRERLLALRAKYMVAGLPTVDKLVPGRLGDITKPLAQIVMLMKPSALVDMNTFIKELADEIKNEAAASPEACVVQAVMDLKDSAQDGRLLTTAVSNRAKMIIQDNLANLLNPQKVGWILKHMGFKRHRLGRGESAYIIDSVILTKLGHCYGLNKSSESSESSDSSGK